MTHPTIFMFAGQGSHYFHMGRELFVHVPLFRDWMEIADEMFKKATGLSVIDEIYDNLRSKSDQFNRTLLTHSAIVMVEHALAQVLLAKGILPSYTLGASLGEFPAAVCSNILTFDSMLQATITQASILESLNTQGGMIAILADPELFVQTPWLNQHTSLAAVNFNNHFIISGSLAKLDLVEKHLGECKHIFWQRLSISQGFHSSIIDQVDLPYNRYLQTLTMKRPEIPFISCMTGGLLKEVKSTHFWDVIRQPILFQNTIQALENQGAYNYVDISPSGTLATFVKYNLAPNSKSKIYTLISPYQCDINRFNAMIAELAS